MQAMIDDYLKKHVLVEVIYFFKREKKHFRENLQDFSEKMISSFNHSDLVWNFFKRSNGIKT
jgi:predicted nucleic-acid-binding protein